MTGYTIEEFYNSDKYNIHGESFRDFWANQQNVDPRDEIHEVLMMTVKYTVLQTLNLIKNRDTISEIESELVSFLFYMEVTNENVE